RASRRVRGAGQRLAAGERVDEARLADVGAPGEGDLQAVHARQRFDRGGGGEKIPILAEQPVAGGVVGAGEGGGDGTFWRDPILRHARPLGRASTACLFVARKTWMPAPGAGMTEESPP